MIEKLKSLPPYGIIILAFIVLSITYFSPVLEHKDLPQMDNTHAIGMAQEINNFEHKTGEKTQWTNSMFCGMPAYQIKGDASKNIFSYLNSVFRLALPYHTVGILFLYMLGFFIFLISLKIDKWMALIGAFAFAFGSYNLIIIIAGHITKAYTIGLMGPVIAGILYTYNKNLLKGGIFTAIALGMQIAYNHVQITYYLTLLVGILVLTKFILAIIQKQITQFAKATGVLIIAAFIAVLPNITNLWTTYEYGTYSIRGKSVLTNKDGAKVQGGLDKDYALAWSLEPKGTFALMVPNVVGGASEPIANSSVAINSVDKQYKKTIGGQSQYWGGRPFTSGPVYAGAIICFLFFLGMFFYKGSNKWWLIIGTLFSFFLAWGKHFPGFTDFMFYHFPLYNKFRTVEMAMVIASFTIPTLGFLGLWEIYKKPQLIKDNKSKFILAFILTGGVSLLFYLFSSSFFSFMSSSELQAIVQQKQQIIQQHAAQSSQISQYFNGLINNLKHARMSLLKADAFRSFLFIVIAAGAIWLFVKGNLKGKYLLYGLGLLILIDLWSVDKRYLNNDNFVIASKMNKSLEATPADKYIMSDNHPENRVFSIYSNPFNDARTSYYHQSIGGYHGAKLRRYQDVIDHYLQKDWQGLIQTLQKKTDIKTIDDKLSAMQVLNMLNAKYIIYNPNAKPIINKNAFGDAWFVNKIHTVNSPDEAIASIGTVPLNKEAIINVNDFKNSGDYNIGTASGKITLTNYKPNHLTYSYNTDKAQLAVFSQIYYPKGWNAYVDGTKVNILRANYILRAAMLPAGQHKVEFKFEPKSYNIGQRIASISSILILLLLIYLGYDFYTKRGLKATNIK